MAKRGPKTKYTPERVARILEFLRTGNTRGTSARASGIDHDTLLRWERKYPEFADQVKTAEQEAVTVHLGNIAQAGARGQWQASAWILERRHYQDWGRKDRVEIISSVRQMATDAGLDESAAVEAANAIFRELRSQQRA